MSRSGSEGSEPVWYCEIDEQESGPFSLEDLWVMASEGTLRTKDRLRKKDSVWVPACRVAGVFVTKGESEQEPVQSRKRNSALQRTQSAAKSRLRWYHRAVSTKSIRLMVGGTVIFAVAAASGWWSMYDTAFPTPVTIAEKPANDRLEAARNSVLRAPVPRIPSIPSLEMNKARPVPGLEDISPAFSPTLSADLKVIVFAGTGAKGGGYDLYISDRSGISERFSAPARIVSCESAETEAYCSLSADGLELIFLRGEGNWKIMYCRRASRNDMFGAPEPWQPEEFDFEPASCQVNGPHFVGNSAIAFCRQPTDGDNTAREFLISYRDAVEKTKFSQPEPLLFFDNTPQYAVSANGQRAYYGWDEGISSVVRGSNNERPFSNSRVLVSAVVIGPVCGTVWVPPKEDMFIFCSPGPGERPGERKLWMVRY